MNFINFKVELVQRNYFFVEAAFLFVSRLHRINFEELLDQFKIRISYLTVLSKVFIKMNLFDRIHQFVRKELVVRQ